MTQIADLLAYLHSLDIQIWVDGDQLRYSAPKGGLAPELRARLIEHKAELIAFLRGRNRPTPQATPAPIQIAPRDGALPLSFAQQGVWLRQQLEPDNPFYNMPMAVRLAGALDLTALERSLNEIVRRHQILRTTFTVVNGRPFQQIGPVGPAALPVVDLAELSARQRQTHIQKLIAQETQRPFDLAQSVFRVTLLKISELEHILLVVAHHLVFDNWSGGLFVREMQRLYNAFVAGQPSPLSDLAIQYADVAHWEQTWRTDEAMAADLDYWRRQLGDPPNLELPTDWPRPAVQTFQGAKQMFRLSRSLTQALQMLSQQAGVTLFMTMLAALNTLLYRYTNQEDIVVGTAAANRSGTQIEELIGLFADLLVLRTSLAGNPTFRELLGRVGKLTLEAYAHQNVPFEKLVQELRPRRDVGSNPFFQIFFLLHNAPAPSVQLSGLSLSHLDYEGSTARYDLDFSLSQDADGLTGTLEYSTDLFRAETITRMLEHFRNLLQGIADNPDGRIAELPLLTEADRQLLRRWNNTQTNYPRDLCVHQLVEAQVMRTPDRVAVVCEGSHITYRELNRRANQLAWHLRGLGAGLDVPVAIYMERTIDMVVGVLGILKAGGAYVPLDPAYPKVRLETILKNVAAPVLVTQECFRDNLPGGEQQVIYLDTDWALMRRQPEQNPNSGVDPENLAYIIHTSGSTGVPKGVALPHRPLANLVLWHSAELSSDVRILQFASLGFDVSFHEMFAAHTSGGAISIISDANRIDMTGLACFFRDHAIQEATLPIVVLQQLAEAFCDAPEYFADVRNIIATGEQLIIHPPMIELFARLDQAQLQNHYGPSETHLVTVLVLPRPASEWARLPLIGRPIANIHVYILDRFLQSVPIGVPGELYIGGLCLARGYLNQPDLTAAKFVPDPFAVEPGGRMYVSGDLARYLPDGTIEFLGRIDRQVKIRGHRVEPGEIEVLLCQHPAVQEAVVVPHEDTPGDKHLVAYIVSPQPEVDRADQLRQFLEAKLPAALVPSAFVPIDKIPLNTNGKVDRRRLPVPDLHAGTAYAAPRSALERQLADLWSRLLDVDQPGIDDNFFDLGGHSLKAASLVQNIHQSFDTKIPFRDVFVTPTIRGLAATIAMARQERFAAIEKVEPRAEYPASGAQKRIFILQQIAPESIAYNLLDTLLIEGDLERERVEATLRKLVDRHEALRTSLFLGPAGALQRIHAAVDFQLAYFEAAEAEVETIAQHFFTSFDLSTAPLLRVGLIKLERRKHVLLFNMHHTIGDGVSLGILIREFVALYEGRALPALHTQYKDYAVWHNNLIGSAVLQPQEDYWLSAFADGVPILNIPTDYPRPLIVGSEGDAVAAVLDRQLTGDLKRLAASHGATLYMVLFAAYSILLSRYTNQEDLVIGSPVSGRTHADLEGMIGMFVNMLAIRCRPESHKTVAEYLGEMKTALVGALEHQDYPFEMLVEKVCRQRDTSRNPLVETTFDLWRQEDLWVASRQFTVRSHTFGSRTAKFDLLLDALEVDGEIHLDFQFSTELFQRATIERMLGHYIQIVAAIVGGQDSRLGELELLTELERRQVLWDFSTIACPYPSDALVHRLIEQQADACADTVAVIFQDQQVTYGALNQRANQLARRLRQAGVRRGDTVCLLLNRSPAIIIAILAVLKAGGAYVPVDPGYPPNRIRFVLDDTGAPAIIADRQVVAGGVFADHERQRVIDVADPQTGSWPSTNLESVNSPEDTAYVIYTSGTSGNPKGVMVSHASLANACFAWRQEYRLDQLDLRVLQVASAAFDLFTGDFVRTFTNGGSMVICPLELVVELPQLYDLLWRHQVNFLETTPALAIPLMDYVYQQGLPIDQLALLVIGSDILNLEDYRRLLERFGGQTRIINSYGVTEAAVDSCYYAAGAGEQLPVTISQGVPIGRPFPNMRLYVLNVQGMPQPVGVPGELCIGGNGVAKGYLNRPDLEQARFVPNPFVPGDRIYKTGDHARWLPGGILEFFGRYDSQVKIGGYRIEIGEIETQLLRHQAVREAVVVDCLNRIGQKYLIGYITLHAPAEPAAIRQFLLDNLPGYMVPGAIRVLDAVPLTPNGKIDRAALVARETSADFQREYLPPRDAIELALAQIWQEVLAVPQISVTDSFFELGGNSLALLTLYNRISASYDAGLSVAELFSCHTIEMLAKRIHRGRRPAPPAAPADQLEQSIYHILDTLERGQIDIDDADQAITQLST